MPNLHYSSEKKFERGTYLRGKFDVKIGCLTENRVSPKKKKGFKSILCKERQENIAEIFATLSSYFHSPVENEKLRVNCCHLFN